MAENEQAHRHSLERNQQNDASRLQLISLIGAISLAVAGIVVGGSLVMNDKALAGFTFFLSAIGALIGTAIYKHRQEKGSSPKEPTKPG